MRNVFNENQPISVDATCLEKNVSVAGGQNIKLVIWDTAGQERYNALNQVYYRGAEGKYFEFPKEPRKHSEKDIYSLLGAIVVYDATEPETFKRMNQWVVELKQYLPPETPIIIAGNKSDLYNNLKIEEETVKQYAKS